MAGVNHVFHVEFGINETKLTQALEDNDYKTAELLIKDCTHASFLDEGCYQRVPLFITLCGYDRPGKPPWKQRNFYLARLLVQYGANPNYRVPETYMAEYISRGKTGFELLIEFYTHLKDCLSLPNYHSDLSTIPVVGLDKQVIDNEDELVNQTLEIISIFIGFGADVNILDDERCTPLHNVLIHSCDDTELVSTLCENGASVNATDIEGNSPLFAICQCRFPFFSPLIHFNVEPSHVCHRPEQLDILMSQNLELNVFNKNGKSTIVEALCNGQFKVARKLLFNGVKIDVASFDVGIKNMNFQRFEWQVCVSPLFAALFSPRVQAEYSFFPKRRLILSHLSCLVDSCIGFFTSAAVFDDLKAIIVRGLPALRHLLSIGEARLFPLLFGRTTAGLKQLVVRNIFYNIIRHDKMTISDLYSEYCWIHFWLRKLHLPLDLKIHFEIECLRHCLLEVLIADGADSDDDDDDLISDSTSSSDMIDDSDLEFW